jgi:hypothetical protein
VLTSDFAEGEELQRFAACSTGAAKSRAAVALLDFYWTPFLARGKYNTDPNSGNFLFAPASVTFLDFGRVKEVSPRFAAQIRRLLRGALERDRAAVRSALVDLGAVPRPDQFDFEHLFRGLLLLLRPFLADGPFTYSNDYLRRLWRAFVHDNPNLHKTHFSADMAFLHQFNFGVTAVLARLGATVAHRGAIMDLLYPTGEERPPPFAEAELALLDL